MTDVYPIPEFLRQPVEAPRETPIIFSAPMVRSLLAGTKLQTRRAIKPVGNDEGFVIVERDDKTLWPWRSDDGESMLTTIGGFTHEIPMSCPYGRAGDRLWVREKWSADPPIDDSWASTEWNGCGRKVREIPERFHHPRFCNYAADWLHEPIRWTPSIHMPRWASRILLEIVSVRVERLQDISEADAEAEGCEPFRRPTHPSIGPFAAGYSALWDSINGPGSWAANPWVWCLTFKRVPP